VWFIDFNIERVKLPVAAMPYFTTFNMELFVSNMGFYT